MEEEIIEKLKIALENRKERYINLLNQASPNLIETLKNPNSGKILDQNDIILKNEITKLKFEIENTMKEIEKFIPKKSNEELNNELLNKIDSYNILIEVATDKVKDALNIEKEKNQLSLYGLTNQEIDILNKIRNLEKEINYLSSEINKLKENREGKTK